MTVHVTPKNILQDKLNSTPVRCYPGSTPFPAGKAIYRALFPADQTTAFTINLLNI